jgi:hypothetical protein
MGESHECGMRIGVPHANMSTLCAYDGVNGVNLRFVAQSFHQLVDRVLAFDSSRINVLFPSFGINGFVVANPLQSSVKRGVETENMSELIDSGGADSCLYIYEYTERYVIHNSSTSSSIIAIDLLD